MQVLSSLSGITFYAPSAGFAPTNSAEVSAIASSYQVVSATATQLNAGTAYLTSVNDTPISASRAGNAVNATQATSAWYDGTGRSISALPDSATVSAIASSYAESAASSKQDTLTFGYNTADQISSIDGSALGGMDEAAVSAIASAYAESAASSKQDTLTFGYNAEDKISSINGSSLAGEGGGGGLVTAIGTSTSGITSINNSGLVDTAALRSADYSSLYVQEPLYISASGDSSYIGISGGAGGVDSATCSAIASAYAESAVSSVSGKYALSSDVSATVDLVGTQSANWGGSALALSAGPGVKLEKVGDTLVASTDETVLWSGSANGNSTLALSETMANFETIKVLYNPWTDNTNTHYFEFDFNKIPTTMSYGIISDMSVYTVSPLRLFYVCFSYSASGLAVSSVNYCDASFTTQALDKSKVSVYKVVGINRTAEA